MNNKIVRKELRELGKLENAGENLCQAMSERFVQLRKKYLSVFAILDPIELFVITSHYFSGSTYNSIAHTLKYTSQSIENIALKAIKKIVTALG